VHAIFSHIASSKWFFTQLLLNSSALASFEREDFELSVDINIILNFWGDVIKKARK